MENKLKSLGINLTENKKEILEKYKRIFLEKNSQLNLISKNDEKYLFEKHIYDSLAMNLFLKPKKGETLLDFGTGGGFPSILIAILYDNLKVVALDSIKKKINTVEEISKELGLKNLITICNRVENIDEKFDYVTTRAVASLDKILIYAEPKLKKDGYFIAYKSKKVEEELKVAKNILKKSTLKFVKTIPYTLPLEETHERCLVIFKKF